MVSDLSVGRSESLGHLTEETMLTIHAVWQCDTVKTGCQHSTAVIGQLTLDMPTKNMRQGDIFIYLNRVVGYTTCKSVQLVIKRGSCSF